MNLRIQNLTILVRNIKTYYQVRATLCPFGVLLCARQYCHSDGFPTGSREEMVLVVRHLPDNYLM